MNNLIFFRGTQAFTCTLPSAAEGGENDCEKADVLGFEAYRTFQDIHELQSAGEPVFTYCQAVAVSEVQRWVFRGASFASVLVSHEAVRWILCFPVTRQGVRYALQTEDISPDGDDVFFFFTGSTPTGTPIRAVPDLDSLKFLSPRPGANLVLVRAGDWHWDEKRDTVSIRPQDVLEMEIVLDSEVRVL